MNESRKDSKQRRKERQKQGIWSVLAALPPGEPPTWGAAAASQYSDLNKWKNLQPPMDWSCIPPQCEPCAMLNTPGNRGKKHGKTVMQQIGMLEFEAEVDVQPPMSSHTQRGMHKRWQVESFLLVLRRLVSADPLRAWNIVDFGCGTGSLLLPLACLFPSCTFTGVDMKPAALAILRQRAAACALTNVHTFLGMIEQYDLPLDIALALHACGNATDAAMLRAQQHRAAYIVSPCCVGKLKFSLAGGTSFGPSASNWRWMPRLRGSEQQVQLAGEWLRAAACGQALPPWGVDTAPGPGGEAAASKLQQGELSSRDDLGGSSPAASARGDGLPGSAQAAGAAGSGEHEGTRRMETRGEAAAGAHPQCPPLELRHPRSQALLQLLPDPHSNFKMLAQVADTNLSLKERQAAGGEAQAHAEVLAAVWGQLEREAGEGQADEDPTSSGKVQSPALAPSEQDDGAAGCEGGVDTQQRQPQQQLHQGPPGLETKGARDAALCALAKLHIEIDRNEQAREEGYAVGILRMLNAQSMAKGDLLVGFPAEAQVWACLLPLVRGPESSVIRA